MRSPQPYSSLYPRCPHPGLRVALRNALRWVVDLVVAPDERPVERSVIRGCRLLLVIDCHVVVDVYLRLMPVGPITRLRYGGTILRPR